MFEVGEIINPENWGLRVQITSLEPLEAVIIKSETTTKTRPPWVDKYFPVGRVLRFERVRGTNSWNIVTDDKDMPWYGLCIYEGRKSFDHYR